MSHSATSHQAPTSLDALNLLATVPLGLTIVAINAPELQAPVRTAFTQQLLHSGNATGLKFAKTKVGKVCSLYAGSERHQQYAQVNHAAAGAVPASVEHEFKSFGLRGNYNWCSPEGLPALLQLVRTPPPNGVVCWYTLAQDITEIDAVLQADAFMQIRHTTKASGVHVMAFLDCQHGADETHFDELCDEYLEVEVCQPDMGHDLAFSINCYGLRNLHQLGIGKTMCNVSYTDGCVTHSYSPYISSDFLTRAIWTLRGMGRSYAQIGDLVGVNKSTVLRKLSNLPKPRPVEVADEWLEQLGDYLNAATEMPSSMEGLLKKKPLIDEDDMDEDDE